MHSVASWKVLHLSWLSASSEAIESLHSLDCRKLLLRGEKKKKKSKKERKGGQIAFILLWWKFFCWCFPLIDLHRGIKIPLHFCNVQLNMRARQWLGPPRNQSAWLTCFKPPRRVWKTIFYSCSYSLFQFLFLILVRKHLLISSSHLAKPHPWAMTGTTLTTLQVAVCLSALTVLDCDLQVIVAE